MASRANDNDWGLQWKRLLTERNCEDGISPLIEGSPISAVACGIDSVGSLLLESRLALARRRLVMVGGGEDIWIRAIQVKCYRGSIRRRQLDKS